MVNKRVLVTGGTGMVGQALANFTKTKPIDEEKWIFVGSKDADLSDLVATRKLFELHQPTHVIHLAAMVGGLFHNMNNNLEFLRKNMQINDNVLLCSHELNVEKVISCLSTCIFPDKTTYPIDETMIHNGAPSSSNFGYSYAKRLIDITNHAYHEKYGHIFTSIIPCNIYGTHDNFTPSVSHVIPGMINRLYALMNDDQSIPQEDKEFVVFGTGTPLRQFIYSKDLAELIVWVLRHYASVDPIILSVDDSDEISIGDCAKLIAKAFNFKGKIVFDTTKADGQYKKTASNGKLRFFMPDFQFTEFEVAISETVRWYIDNQNSVRK